MSMGQHPARSEHFSVRPTDTLPGFAASATLQEGDITSTKGTNMALTVTVGVLPHHSTRPRQVLHPRGHRELRASLYQH